MVDSTMAFDPEPRVVSRVSLSTGDYSQDFDVSPDGKWFLMIQPLASGVSVVVTPNWRTELRRLTKHR